MLTDWLGDLAPRKDLAAGHRRLDPATGVFPREFESRNEVTERRPTPEQDGSFREPNETAEDLESAIACGMALPSQRNGPSTAMPASPLPAPSPTVARTIGSLTSAPCVRRAVLSSKKGAMSIADATGL